MRTPTKNDYEQSINELEVPFHDCESNGGRIPDNAEYGTWLRRNDPIAFNVGFNDWTAGQQQPRKPNPLHKQWASMHRP